MIKVAIIEDHQILVDALRLMMSNEPDLEFVGSASNFQDGVQLVKHICADVLLLDVGLPDGDGLNILPYVKANQPETQVIVLTSSTDEATLVRAIEMGISGFVPKGNPLTELMYAIRHAAEGEIIVQPSLLISLIKKIPRQKTVVQKDENMWEELTQRELEVLQMLARGRSGTIIANELHIAPLTVRTHIRNLMSKLGVHSRLEAVAFGLQNGLIQN